MKTFLTIVGILLVVIIICLGVQEYKQYEDKQLLARQKEELDKQSQQIFLDIETNINQTNQTISETDEKRVISGRMQRKLLLSGSGLKLSWTARDPLP